MATTAEYGLGENAFPRGWFMIAIADEVSDMPKSVRFFGRDMVLFRGKASGRLVLLDAYCPHQKVHLGKSTKSYIVTREGGQVEGDSIRCPAHGWRFGPDGKCDDIPYSTHGIPKAACIKSHIVVEQAGCVWMWHDMENGLPNFDLPAFAEWDMTDQGWVRWTPVALGVIPIHPQEIVDNFADRAHFGPVHGCIDDRYFQNKYDGPMAYQYYGSGHRTMVDGGDLLETDTYYTGPGIIMTEISGRYPARLMICHTPVDDGSSHCWFAQMSKTGEHGPATDEEKAAAQTYHEQGLAAFEPDFELWQYKQAAINILQIPDDGPFHKGRIWYSQFYNPRAKERQIQDRVNGTHTTMSGKGFHREVA